MRATKLAAIGGGTRTRDDTMQMPREIGTFHIIGIGGIGMSAIAEILLAKG